MVRRNAFVVVFKGGVTRATRLQLQFAKKLISNAYNSKLRGELLIF